MDIPMSTTDVQDHEAVEKLLQSEDEGMMPVVESVDDKYDISEDEEVIITAVQKEKQKMV